MHIKSSSDYRSCQTLHNPALRTIQLHLSLLIIIHHPPLPFKLPFSHFPIGCPQMYILIRSPGTWSKFWAWNPYLWCSCGECPLIFEEIDSSGKPLRADIEMYHWDPLGGGRCCPAVGMWSVVSSFKAGLSYRIALTEITSSLGSPHLQIKGRPFLSLVRHSDGQSLALSGSLSSTGAHTAVWLLLPNTAFCYSLHRSGSLI